MNNIPMKSLLEAGVHFGHQTWRWNPKMSRFIFGERNNIHIIDLQKTVKEIKKTYSYVKDAAAEGKTFLFVGTKKQAQEIITTEARRADSPYAAEKWLGGTLTNFSTLRKSVKRLEELEKWQTDGLFKVISKKEGSRLSKEMAKLKKNLTGIRNLNKLPDVLFAVDPLDEELAVFEARRLHIPVVAVCDTDCDPDLIDYPLPGNDDAARSIKFFCSLMADAILEGRAERQQKQAASVADAEKQMLATVASPEEVPEDGASAFGAPSLQEAVPEA